MFAKHTLLTIFALMLSASQVNAQTENGSATATSEVRCNIAPDHLTAVELNRLGAHDIVILVDRSGSMNTCDCPKVTNGGLKASKLRLLLTPGLLIGGSTRSSRWDWCADQALEMSTQARSALPNGFTVILFGSHSSIHQNMSTETLPQLFRSTIPMGPTYLGPALANVCKKYFKQRDESKSISKPLLIGVITDGVPLDPERVTKSIVDATHKMSYPQEITVIFFLIGQDDGLGNQFIRQLIYELPRRNASYNIVRAVPFWELEKSGLARSLSTNLD
jgi:hypothetical protein